MLGRAWNSPRQIRHVARRVIEREISWLSTMAVHSRSLLSLSLSPLLVRSLARVRWMSTEKKRRVDGGREKYSLMIYALPLTVAICHTSPSSSSSSSPPLPLNREREWSSGCWSRNRRLRLHFSSLLFPSSSSSCTLPIFSSFSGELHK